MPGLRKIARFETFSEDMTQGLNKLGLECCVEYINVLSYLYYIVAR